MTHTKDEALKLALEALENGKRVRNAEGGTKYQPDLEDNAITAIKQALAAPVQPVACFIGAKGSAFDLPETKRAYTYKEQPGNAVASKLGRACEAANKQRAGDNIDRGLGLLQELQKEGFGVFALGAEYTTQPAPVPTSWMEMVTANLVREGVNKHKARELAEHFYGLAPAAQPAPTVQEPVSMDAIYGAWHGAGVDIAGGNWSRFVGMLPPLYTTPPAPAVPDAIHHTDLSEHPEYIQGWNDYRKAIMEMLK
jgi:hypothetical protein